MTINDIEQHTHYVDVKTRVWYVHGFDHWGTGTVYSDTPFAVRIVQVGFPESWQDVLADDFVKLVTNGQMKRITRPLCVDYNKV